MCLTYVPSSKGIWNMNEKNQQINGRHLPSIMGSVQNLVDKQISNSNILSYSFDRMKINYSLNIETNIQIFEHTYMYLNQWEN